MREIGEGDSVIGHYTASAGAIQFNISSFFYSLLAKTLEISYILIFKKV